MNHTLHPFEARIREYFAACNAGDYARLMACFTSDAVHYFPPGLPEVPWIGADTISKKWVWCVENLGSQWTIEKILISHNSNEAVIEWTHWKRHANTALRGDEWYIFEPSSGLIKEIRAYYATPGSTNPDSLVQVGQTAVAQLVGFDYANRGYHLRWE